MFTLQWKIKFDSGIETYSRKGLKDFSYNNKALTLYFEDFDNTYPIYSETFPIIGKLISIELMDE